MSIAQASATSGLNEAASAVVFHGKTWADYMALLKIAGDGPVRVNYDRGSMQVRMPSRRHERDAYFLARIVDTLTEELDVRMQPGGETTHHREDLDRGAEPDQCYWLNEHAGYMVGRDELDLTTDPPPDLIIEVDVAASAVPRLPIFAALGVPEVWHVAEHRLRFLRLQPDGEFLPQPNSRAFPMLTVEYLSALLERARVEDGLSWLREFREHIRARGDAAGL